MKYNAKLPILTQKGSLIMSFSPSFAPKSVSIRVNPCQNQRESAKSADIFMQNKAKLQKAEIRLSPYIANGYVNLSAKSSDKNKAKTKPNKAKSNPILTPLEQKQTQSNPTCSEPAELFFGQFESINHYFRSFFKMAV